MGTSLRPIQKTPDEFCPECGGIMILRSPRDGQSYDPFYGCRDFPDCKGTLAIDDRTGKPFEDHIAIARRFWEDYDASG